MTITVVVADDQAVVRDGLVLLLGAAPDVEVVGVAEDGQRAVELVHELRPAVALVDLRMPGLDGAEVTARLAAERSDTRVLILTTFADDQAVLPALRSGAAGYLTKDTTSEALLSAIRDVANGRTVLDPTVQARLVERLRSADEPDLDKRREAVGGTALGTTDASRGEPRPEQTPEGLTRREIDVIRLVGEGLGNREVARRMVVSEATVKTHINHVLSKLDLDGRAALIAWAWRRGLVER